VHGKGCKVLDIKPGTAIVNQDIFVERESVLMVKIRDAEGQPLTGVWASGIRRHATIRLPSDSCPAYGVEAGKPRLMVFYEPIKKLAGSLTLKGDEKQPIVAHLGPAGAIKGRLLDADGKPLAGVAVDVHYPDHEAKKIHENVHKAKLAVTDATGVFALDELIPQQKFELTFRRGKQQFKRETKPAEAVQVKPGECRDLGALKLKPEARGKEE
jgi:hypothetical protein